MIGRTRPEVNKSEGPPKNRRTSQEPNIGSENIGSENVVAENHNLVRRSKIPRSDNLVLIRGPFVP